MDRFTWSSESENKTMRSLWDVSDLFVCLILTNINAVTSVVYVENGKSLTLNPNIQGTPEDILWTYNGNKVAEHDLTEFQDYGPFKGRAEIEISTGQLTVRHMTSHDSGIYTSAIQISGKLQNSDNEVKVIDAVQEPNVTCNLNNTSRTLFCSVSSQFNVSYEWTGAGSAPQSGQELHIISKEEKPDSVYTCTVKNEVSQKSSSFTVKNCDTDEPPSEQNIILPVVLPAVILVIAAAVAFYFIRQKRKKEDEKGTKNNMMEMREPSGTRAKNDQEKRIDSENGQVNEEQEVTEHMDKDERVPLVHTDAQMKSDSEKGHISEEDEQETSEEQALNEPEVRCEGPSSRSTDLTSTPQDPNIFLKCSSL